MEKDILERYIAEDFSANQIARITRKSLTTVVYWLAKYGLKTKRKSFKQMNVIVYVDNKFCPSCKENKALTAFYQRRGKIAGSVYCKVCTKIQVLERQRNIKQQAIDYKGGQCEKCGYNKCNAALEFHHINPEEKDFNVSHMKGYTFTEKVKKELDKCILVCANCHREIHQNLSKSKDKV